MREKLNSILFLEYFYIFKDYSNKIIEYNKVLTFIAYLILLIGLYIEIVRRIEESIRLNSQVNDFQKLKIKYKEIKAVEKAVWDSYNKYDNTTLVQKYI